MNDIPSWVSAVCAVLTAIGAALSWWHSSLSKRAQSEAEQARDDAVRKLEAIEQTAAGIQKVANMLEYSISAPPWQISWRSGETYYLVNAGNIRAEDVHIDADTKQARFDPPEDGPIDARSSAVFFFGRYMNTPLDAHLVVTWTLPNGSRETWRGPIPPRGDH